MFTVEINNIPKDLEEYTVARYVDGEWWFWGTFANEEKAKEVANTIEGAVFKYIDI